MTRVNGFGLTPKQSLVALVAIVGGTWLLYECGAPFIPASGIAFSVVMSIAGSSYLARIHRQQWRDRHPPRDVPRGYPPENGRGTDEWWYAYRIGQSLWTLLIAFVGGILARYLYLRRERAAQELGTSRQQH